MRTRQLPWRHRVRPLRRTRDLKPPTPTPRQCAHCGAWLPRDCGEWIVGAVNDRVALLCSRECDQQARQAAEVRHAS